MFQEILKLPHIDNFHFIGHSLGAHLGGYCGHELQKVRNIYLSLCLHKMFSVVHFFM